MDSNFDFDRVHEKMLWSMAEHILVNYLSARLSKAIGRSGPINWDRDISPHLNPIQNADPKLVKDLSRCDLNVLLTLYRRRYSSLLPQQINQQHLYLLRDVRNQFAHQSSRVGENDVHFSRWEPIVRMIIDCLGVSPSEVTQYELLRDTKLSFTPKQTFNDSIEFLDASKSPDVNDFVTRNKQFLDSIVVSREHTMCPSDFHLSMVHDITDQVLSQRVSYLPASASSSNLSLAGIICSTQEHCCFTSNFQRRKPLDLVLCILKSVYDQYGCDVLDSIDFSLDDAMRRYSPLSFWLMLVRSLASIELFDSRKFAVVCIEAFDSHPEHFRNLVQSIVNTAPEFIRFILDSRVSVSDPVLIERSNPVREYYVKQIESVLAQRVTNDVIGSIINSTCANAVCAEIAFKIITKLVNQNRPIEIILPEDPDKDWLCYVCSNLLLPSQLANLATMCTSMEYLNTASYEVNATLVEYGLVSSGDNVYIHPMIKDFVQSNAVAPI